MSIDFAGLLDARPDWTATNCANCGRVFDWPMGIVRLLAKSDDKTLVRALDRPLCDRCDGSADAVAVPRATPQTPEAAGVPEGTPNHPLDDELLRWLLSDRQTLFLTGRVAAGKTSQLKSVVRWWQEHKGRHVLYRTEPQLMRGLRDYENPLAASRLLQTALTCDLLIVDDVGTHHVGIERATGQASGWTYSQWIEIIDARFRSKRTIVATNLDAKQFGALPYIDARIRSRLSERGAQIIMHPHTAAP